MGVFDLRKRDCRRKKFRSAGGKAVQWTWEPGIEAVALGRRFKVEAVFSDTPTILLGRKDFLSHFKASFDERALRVQLEPY